MNLTQKNKLIKRVKLFLSVLWWSVLVLLVITLVNVLSAKMSGRVPSVFGYSVMHIESGSMEGEIPNGSYILIKKVEPSEIKKDDIICFYSTDPKIYGIPNTHRVIEDPIYTENGIEFITKGDANPKNDTETATGQRLIGVYVKRLDGLTAFSDALSGKTLLFIIIGIQICMVGMFIYVTVKTKTKEIDKKSK
jgi:signal peptidase I